MIKYDVFHQFYISLLGLDVVVAGLCTTNPSRRGGSLSSTCQTNILRPISHFKPAMRNFTPWRRTEAGVRSARLLQRNKPSWSSRWAITQGCTAGWTLGLPSQIHPSPRAPRFPSPRAPELETSSKMMTDLSPPTHTQILDPPAVCEWRKKEKTLSTSIMLNSQEPQWEKSTLLCASRASQ